MKKTATMFHATGVLLFALTIVGMSNMSTKALSTAYQWSFESATSPLDEDNASQPSLFAYTNWSGSIVRDTNGANSAVYFPGWTETVNGKVNPTASLLSASHHSNFNADQTRFSFGADIVALDPKTLVQSKVMVKADTLNIMQKGLAGSNKEQWKLSVNTVGKFICSFRGPSASGQISEYKTVSVIYPFGVNRTVRCSLENSVITMDVTTGASTQTYTAAGPTRVVNDSEVSVGKKPGSDYPGDTFAGTLDNIFITKS